MLFFEFKNENETKYIFFLRDKKTEMFVHKKNETLTSLLRPPLPCATSWLHRVPVTHASRAYSTILYYAMKSEAVTSLKTGDFVRHLDTLLVIRSKKMSYLVLINPFWAENVNKIRVSSFKKCFFRLLKTCYLQKIDWKDFF